MSGTWSPNVGGPTNGNDTYAGTPGNDAPPDGRAGRDSMDGQGGNDSLLGSFGRDILLGGEGNDTLRGQDGNDSILGGAGDDSISAGIGSDTVDGGAGADLVRGNDPRSIQELRDLISANGGGVTQLGDTSYLGTGTPGANGNDFGWTQVGQFDADGDGDQDGWVMRLQNFSTSAGTLTLRTGTNDNAPIALSGVAVDARSELYFFLPTSTLGNGNAGAGTLRATLDLDDANPLSKNANNGPQSQFFSGFDGDNAPDSLAGGDGDDTLLGEGGNDTLTGDGDNDSLLGGTGNDSILGGAGNDTISGGPTTVASGTIDNDSIAAGAGDDVVLGGAGNDTVAGDTGADSLLGGAGADSMLGEAGNDTLEGGAGADRLDGGADTNTLAYAGSTAGVTVDLLANTATGGDATGDVIANFTNVIGSTLADTLAGNEFANTIDGGEGNDVITGGEGEDRLIAGAGDDSVVGGAGVDVGDLGTGNDTIAWNGGDGADTWFGGTGIDQANLQGPQADWTWVSLDGAGAGGDGASGNDWQATNTGGDGTVVTFIDFERVSFGGDPPVDMPCFAEGTRLLTPRGEVPVEALRAGDTLVTAGGRVAPVLWVGHRAVDLARHPRPGAAAPVRIAAGALGDGAPLRDLRVSPDHALLLDGVLVPALALVDGRRIIQEGWCRAVRYFHVELDRHDVVVADGAAAESWLDDGNRHLFANAGTLVALHPDFAPRPAGAWADGRACAPRVAEGPALERIRLRLAVRAAARRARAG